VIDLSEFRASLSCDVPPAGISGALEALWWDAKGEWDRAHSSAQSDPGQLGNAVHAYLHRKEGNLANARYWYARAGRPPATAALEVERDALVREIVKEKST
jgi:hypothetical protein